MVSDSEKFLGGKLELPDSEATPPSPPKQSKPVRSRFKVIAIFISGAIIVGMTSYAVWRIFLNNDAEQSAQPAQVTTPQDDSPALTDNNETDDIPITLASETFKSTTPRLELSHPEDWTVTPSDDGLRIESPEFTYQTLDKGEVAGNFRIYIRQGARAVDSTYIGRGIAVKPSENLSYTDPATGQREETNLSFFGLDTTDHFAYFLIVGNFVLDTNDTLGPDYGKEPQTYLITGGYSSPELNEDFATNKVSLDYFQSTNAYSQAIEILKSLKLM